MPHVPAIVVRAAVLATLALAALPTALLQPRGWKWG
jgi:hypothetical protein